MILSVGLGLVLVLQAAGCPARSNQALPSWILGFQVGLWFRRKSSLAGSKDCSKYAAASLISPWVCGWNSWGVLSSDRKLPVILWRRRCLRAINMARRISFSWAVLGSNAKVAKGFILGAGSRLGPPSTLISRISRTNPPKPASSCRPSSLLDAVSSVVHLFFRFRSASSRARRGMFVFVREGWLVSCRWRYVGGEGCSPGMLSRVSRSSKGLERNAMYG